MCIRSAGHQPSTRTAPSPNQSGKGRRCGYLRNLLCGSFGRGHQDDEYEMAVRPVRLPTVSAQQQERTLSALRTAGVIGQTNYRRALTISDVPMLHEAGIENAAEFAMSFNTEFRLVNGAGLTPNAPEAVAIALGEASRA